MNRDRDLVFRLHWRKRSFRWTQIQSASISATTGPRCNSTPTHTLKVPQTSRPATSFSSTLAVRSLISTTARDKRIWLSSTISSKTKSQSSRMWSSKTSKASFISTELSWMNNFSGWSLTRISSSWKFSKCRCTWENRTLRTRSLISQGLPLRMTLTLSEARTWLSRCTRLMPLTYQ